MTRKRYIKLLMGKFSVSRNEARRDADMTPYFQNMREHLNHEAKVWGIKCRMKPRGYVERWEFYAELLKKGEEYEKIPSEIQID